QAADERVADLEDLLDHFDRLNRAHHPRERAEHARLGAVRDEAGRGRRRKEAPVAAVTGLEDGRLAVEEENTAVHEHLVREVESGRAAETAGADDQYLRFHELALADRADLRHDDVPRVAVDLLRR